MLAAALLCLARIAGAQSANVECCNDTPNAASACVWLNRGSGGGLSAGQFLPLFNGDRIAGLFEPELIVEGSSTGTITRAAGYAGPLCTLRDGGNADQTNFRYEIRAGAASYRSLPEIVVPDGSEKAMLSGDWRPEWDAELHNNLLGFAQQSSGRKTPFPLFPGNYAAPPPAIVASALADSAPRISERPVIAENDGVVAVKLDPKIADALKSSYYVEPGDCLHIAPWPGAPHGMVVRIDENQTIPYPGAAVETAGKTVSRIERELTGFLRAANPGAHAAITPCRSTEAVF